MLTGLFGLRYRKHVYNMYYGEEKTAKITGWDLPPSQGFPKTISWSPRMARAIDVAVLGPGPRRTNCHIETNDMSTPNQKVDVESRNIVYRWWKVIGQNITQSWKIYGRNDNSENASSLNLRWTKTPETFRSCDEMQQGKMFFFLLNTFIFFFWLLNNIIRFCTRITHAKTTILSVYQNAALRVTAI
jgi:hypothetical protein